MTAQAKGILAGKALRTQARKTALPFHRVRPPPPPRGPAPSLPPSVADYGHLDGAGFGYVVDSHYALLLLGKLISFSFEQIRKRLDSLLELVS